MHDGLVIYRDFFEQHHSPFYWFISKLFIILPESVFSLYILRIMMFVMLLIICLLLKKLHEEIFKKGGEITILIFLLNVHVIDTVTDIRTDIPMIIFQIIALLFLVRFIKSKNPIYLITSAISLSGSFLILQKSLIFSFGVGLMMLYMVYKKHCSFIDLLKYWATFTVPIILMILYYFSGNMLDHYLFYNWIINMNWGNEVGPLIQGRRWIEINSISLFLFTIGFYSIFKDNKQYIRGILVLVSYLSISIMLYSFSFQQYWLPFHIINSMIASLGFYFIYDKENSIKPLIIFMIIFYPMTYILRETQRNNHEQIEKIRYVLDNSSEVDLIYDGDIRFNLFRRDIDFYYFSVRPHTGGLATEQKLRGYDYNIYKIISEKKPKIISTYYIDDLENSIIKNNYKKSKKYEELYIFNGY